MLFWSLLIILALLVLIDIAVLSAHSREVLRRKDLFLASLWARRHRLPLLIEVTRKSVSPASLIDMRSKLQSQTLSLLEEIQAEKELTHLIQEVFSQTEFDPVLEKDSLALALRKEFSELLEQIRMRLNDYQFALEKWQRLIQLPWCKIFKFAFSTSKLITPPTI